MMITPLSWEYLKAFHFYNRGFLAGGRGWIYESNKYMQAMMVIDNEYSKIQNETMTKEQGRQNGRNKIKHTS